MTLVKFEPFRGFQNITRRMNDIFGDLEKGVRFEIGDFAPRVDISEDDKNVYVHAELPGVTKENVKITVSEDRVLTIKGEKKRDETTEQRNYVRVERNYGSFTRSFLLPDNVDYDAINAKFDSGVLDLALPKIQPQKPKEREVAIN